MLIVFLLGLVLLAFSVSLVLRAAGGGRVRLTQNLDQIGSYGFGGTSATPNQRGRVRIALDDFATIAGNSIGARFSRLDEVAIRKMLMGAGMYGIAPRRFTGYRVLAAGAGALTWLWLGLTGGWSMSIVAFGTPIAVIVGWTLPLSLLRRRAERRLSQVDYDLPELIDLLVVTVEAGLSFSASLVVAAERLSGPLGEELRLTLQEQAMGLATNEALQNMLERADTPAMRSFVRSMLQGETLGVSIGKILRDLAQEMRKRRRAAAEERAQKAPVKILFPLIFMIFPAMFVVLLGPAIFTFLKALHG
jgi:tight adherence protein C